MLEARAHYHRCRLLSDMGGGGVKAGIVEERLTSKARIDFRTNTIIGPNVSTNLSITKVMLRRLFDRISWSL